MRVEILQNVGNDQQGAVIDMDDRRAQRLIRTGYAKAVQEPKREAKKAKAA